MEKSRFRLDLVDERLLRGGEFVQLTKKPFELLRFFYQNPNRLLTKSEILKNVWPGVHVCEGAVKEYVHGLRAALGDDPKTPRYIETVRGRGYRYLGGIDEINAKDNPAGFSKSNDYQKSSNDRVTNSRKDKFWRDNLPSKPSVAVLPLDNSNGDARFEYFADGITEDIITNLSKYQQLFVIARDSAFIFKHRSPPTSHIARYLRVRYLISGSIRRTNDNVRITIHLVDTISDRLIWAETFNRSYEYIFELQDDLTQLITSALAVKIESLEIERMRQLPPEHLDAYGLVLLAQYNISQHTREGNIQARKLYRNALKLDDHYARAVAGLSRTYNMDWRYQWTSSPDTALAKALELARSAVTIDRYNSRAYAELGFVNLYRKQHEACLNSYKRALGLNPNDADIMAEMSDALQYVGRPRKAIDTLEKAMRLNPFYPDFYLWVLAGAYFVLERYEDVIKTIGRMHNPTEGRRLLAASYAHLGRREEAQRQADFVLKAHPNFSLEYWQRMLPDKRSEYSERLIEGLKKSGL